MEGGFALEKATAHSLISKAALLLEDLDEVLRKAFHTNPYIRMDETYHRIVNEEKNEQGKATRKGYLWSAMANTLQLVDFFYKEGSRGKDGFQDILINHTKALYSQTDWSANEFGISVLTVETHCAQRKA